MSGLNGRRGVNGVNVSQYLQNLNVPDELLESPTTNDDDLALFAGNEFMDWDGSSGFDANPAPFDMNFDQPASAVGPSVSDPKMDFSINSNFDFADFTFQTPIVDPSMQTLPHTQPSTYAVAPTFVSPNAAMSPMSPGFDPSSGKKRKLSNLEPVDPRLQLHPDDPARHVAEEDKRRRNTAASARFRIKKKQREQALEKTAKEMSDRVSVLETRIQQLETENTWLKGLITEKNGSKVSNPDISAMLKKHVEENASERIRGNRTDGVGTKSGEIKA